MKGVANRLLVCAIAVVAVAAGACGSSGKTSTSAGGAASLTIRNFAFTPSPLTVRAGSVEVANADSTPHTVTADDKSFDTSQIGAGGKASIQLSKAGTYNFHCDIHQYMKGTVIVTP